MLSRKRNRRAMPLGWRTIVVLLVALLFPLVLVVSVTTNTSTIAQAGGEHVEGVVGSPLHINPLLASFNEPDKDLSALVFSGLIKINERGEPHPDLATDWTISPDGLTYTFNLRRGVTWHNGAPFTAEDVTFTIRTVQKPDFPGSPDLAEAWKGIKVEKVSDLTVRFTLPQPSGPFLTQTSLGVLPAFALAQVPAADLMKQTFNLNPIGTGPFRVQDATVQAVVLEVNPGYYGSMPYLSRITFDFFPTQEDLIQALKKGEVSGGLLRSPSQADLAAFGKDVKLNLFHAPRFTYELVFFNNNDPLFKEPEVRQALAYATDRQQIIQNQAEGEGLVADSPILPGTWAYEAGAKKYNFNLDKARSILDAAGWKLGPDGIRTKNGLQLKFTIFTDISQRRVNIAQELSREWDKAGIKVEVASSGASGLVQNFMLPRRYQAALLGMVLGPDPDPFPTWHSSQKDGPGYNFSGFSDAKADDLLARARKSSVQSERTKLYSDFQKLFAENEPSLLLYYPFHYYAVSKDIKGVEMGNLFEGNDRFRNVAEWYVKTKTVEAKGSLLERVVAMGKGFLGR
ncbi:MAG: ABC transporter substrate-binding protein [Dehalococcoidia bacterium]|nr:ABC transporter substrate-binding protein [Dehalococcoidia bacterium]